MLVKIHNAPSKRAKDLIKDACRFAANFFFDKRVLSNLVITIKFENGLIKNSGMMACCSYLDGPTRPRTFEIEIDKSLSIISMLLCIFHEMVHVKQYAKNELYDSSRDCKKFKWLNKWYNEDKINYFDQPWEIEAHGREKGLFLRWLAFTDLLTDEQRNQLETKYNFTES